MPIQQVTDGYWGVLELLWKHPDGATVWGIVLTQYGQNEHSLRGGVKIFLDRFQQKELVAVDKSGFAHRFRASVTHSESVGRERQKPISVGRLHSVGSQ